MAIKIFFQGVSKSHEMSVYFVVSLIFANVPINEKNIEVNLIGRPDIFREYLDKGCYALI